MTTKPGSPNFAAVPATAPLALFDMDRTLVETHTAKLYVRFQRDQGEMGAWMALRASIWLAQYTLGIVNAESVAERVLRDYRGKDADWLLERCRGWFSEYVEPEVSPVGRRRVREHVERGSHVAIATSAVRQIAQPLAEHLGIPDLVCSELEQRNGRLTGEFCQPLCYAEGKRERAQALAASLGTRLSLATFYTDSITDAPLLEAVGQPVAVNPDSRLRRLAQRRGWRMENWLSR